MCLYRKLCWLSRKDAAYIFHQPLTMVTIAATMEKEGMKLHAKLGEFSGNKRAASLMADLEEHRLDMI
jgi:hypothetical protein